MALDGAPSREGQPSGWPGLRPLLTTTHAQLRHTVILAMCRLNDEQAIQELNRLALDPHPRLREKAVRSMQETGNPVFVPVLIRLAWTEADPSVKRGMLGALEELLPPEAGGPEFSSAGGLAALPSIDDKIKVWAAWQASRNSP